MTSGQQRPDHQRPAEAVARDVDVGGAAGEIQPGRIVAMPSRRARASRPATRSSREDLGREDGPAERHVVHAGQSRAAAAGHQQPRCAGESRDQCASRLPDAPPMSFGAASRPIEAPMPMTISEITDVPSERRNDSRSPSPHTTSSISVLLPGVSRRSRYQATPPNAPAASSSTGAARQRPARPRPPSRRRGSRTRGSGRCTTTAIRAPNSPAATPVAATMTQNTGVSAASPSPVAFGCSVAPRPDGSLVRISGGGMRTRPDGSGGREVPAAPVLIGCRAPSVTRRPSHQKAGR